jgi:hypothetical protein
MTLSTIEKHYLRKELMNIHVMAESIFRDNLPSTTTLTPENVNVLLDRRDHLMDKIESLTKVIEQ